MCSYKYRFNFCQSRSLYHIISNISGVSWSEVSIWIVMAMESQAEALGQLTTDDLEGKVAIMSLLKIPFRFSCLNVVAMIIPFCLHFQIITDENYEINNLLNYILKVSTFLDILF